MTIKAVTPVAAAANPSHPDHARWVKEQTLAREIAHAQIVGGSLRTAEDANLRSLARLEQRKASAKPKPRKPARRELSRADIDPRVTRKVAKPRVMPTLTCKSCGMCRTCKRLLRVGMIQQRARQLEPLAMQLANALTVMVLAHDMRKVFRDHGAEFPFDKLTGHARKVALNAATDRICDRSAAAWGDWR